MVLRRLAYPFENSLRDQGLLVPGDNLAGVSRALDPQHPRVEHHERIRVQRRHVEVIRVLFAQLCHGICRSSVVADCCTYSGGAQKKNDLPHRATEQDASKREQTLRSLR